MKDFGFRILAYSGSVFMSINIKVVVFGGGEGGGYKSINFINTRRKACDNITTPEHTSHPMSSTFTTFR